MPARTLNLAFAGTMRVLDDKTEIVGLILNDAVDSGVDLPARLRLVIPANTTEGVLVPMGSISQGHAVAMQSDSPVGVALDDNDPTPATTLLVMLADFAAIHLTNASTTDPANVDILIAGE